jgi:AraC-like DNA-binding protein
LDVLAIKTPPEFITFLKEVPNLLRIKRNEQEMSRATAAPRLREMSSRLDRITNWAQRAGQSGYRVSILAKDCGVTDRQLRRYFLETFQCSPRQWMNARKFEWVHAALAGGELAKNLVQQAGFSHPSHFSRALKQHRDFPQDSTPAEV